MRPWYGVLARHVATVAPLMWWAVASPAEMTLPPLSGGLDQGVVMASHTSAGYRTGMTNAILCQVSYPSNQPLLSLSWCPVLPSGWQIVSVDGPGGPEVRSNGFEIVFTGVFTNNPVSFTYSYTVPGNDSGSHQAQGRVEYQLAGAINPTTVWATPSPLIVTNLPSFYWVSVSAQNGGTATALSDWYAYRRILSLTATPTNGFLFTKWVGTVTGGEAANNPLSVTVTNPVTLQACFVSLSSLLPAAPEGLAATALSSNRIDLSWSDVATNETGYRIERKPGAAGTWVQVALLETDHVQYSDESVSENTLYYYRIRAYNPVGDSTFSAEASATTPSAGPECGYLLAVSATALTFDGQSAGLPVELNGGTMVGGSISCVQSSPRGNGAVQRVALGFRNSTGQAIGACVEIPDLYGVPGCPPIQHQGVPIPAGLLAPAEIGTNSLWIESYVTMEDPCALFTAGIRTVGDNTKQNLGLVTVRPTLIRTVRVLDGQALLNNLVTLPVRMTAYGDENAIGFSLRFDTNALEWLSLTPGTEAASAWMDLNTNHVSSGSIGAVEILPVDQSFGEGSREIARATFLVRQAVTTVVSFTELPVPLEVADQNADSLPASWADGTVIGLAGFEGDVSPRSISDALVTLDDYRLISQFATDPQSVQPGGEFQRADCAPRSARGNGEITVADALQARRYADGLDPLTEAGGPSRAGMALLPDSRKAASAPAEGLFTIRSAATDFDRGNTNLVPIQFVSGADADALSFTIAFDPALLTYLDCRLVGPGTNAAFYPNSGAVSSGRFGVTLLWPEGAPVQAGSNTVMELCFASSPGGVTATSQVFFANTPTPLLVCWNAGTEVVPLVMPGTITVRASVAAPEVPVAPLWTTAETMATNEIYLAWSNEDGRADAFVIDRQTSQGGAWSQIAVLGPQVTSYIDPGLTPATSYRYVIRATNAAGYSSYSAETGTVTWLPIQMWRRNWFGSTEDAGAGANGGDQDGDGTPNLMEYALGWNPLIPSALPLLRMRLERIYADSAFMTLTYDASNVPPADVTLRAETAADLCNGAWATNTFIVTEGWTNGVYRVKVRSGSSLDGKRMEFIRLRVISR
jgi:hypothetical protein